jgi:NADH dehydrogenase FAD-containing subunit
VNIAIAPPAATPVPAGVPKTGQMTEGMARVAAHNIAADINGAPHKRMPYPIWRRSASSTQAAAGSSSMPATCSATARTRT